MKSFATIALFVAVASAQMTEYKSLFKEFGNCNNGQFGDYDVCERLNRGSNAQCCKF